MSYPLYPGGILALLFAALVGASCTSQRSLAPELLRPFPPEAEIVSAWQAGIVPGSRVDDGLVTVIRSDWETISTPPTSGLRTYNEILKGSSSLSANGAYQRALAAALGISYESFERVELREVTTRQVRSVNELDAVAGTYIWAVWYATEATAAFGDEIGAELSAELDPEQEFLKRISELKLDFDADARTVRVGRSANLALAAQFISLEARSRRGDRLVDLRSSALHELPFGYRASVLDFFWNHGDAVFEILNPQAGYGRRPTILRLDSGRSVPVRYEPGQLAGVPGAVTDVFTYHAEREGGRYTGRATLVVHRTLRQWAASPRGQLAR